MEIGEVCVSRGAEYRQVRNEKKGREERERESV